MAPQNKRYFSCMFRGRAQNARKTRTTSHARQEFREEKNRHVHVHTSVLFHHINDAIVNCTRRNNLQSCGNKLLHFILERVSKGGKGGGGGGGYPPF